MPPTTGTPSKSVLQGIPPEDRQAALIEALCAELETAIRAREKATEKADSLREGRQKETDALIAEMELLVRYRDDALAELARVRAEHSGQLTALRTALEATSKERDAMLLRMAETEEAHKEEMRTTAEQQAPKTKPSDHDLLTRERDAYKMAADKLLGQRTQALKERDKAAAELAAERDRLTAEYRDQETRHASGAQAQQKQIEKLKRRQTALEKDKREFTARLDEAKGEHTQAHADLAQQFAQAREEHQQEVTNFTAQRDEWNVLRDQLSAQLDALRHERDEIAAKQHATSEGFKVALEQRAQELHTIAVQHDTLATEREQLAAQLAEARRRHQQEIESLKRERDELVEAHKAIAAQSAPLSEAKKGDAGATSAPGVPDDKAVQALTAQIARLTMERSARAAELDRAGAAHAQQVESLTKERDGLMLARNAIAAEYAKVGEQQKGDIEKLAAHHDELTKERNRVTAELAHLRETHTRKVETLTRERDGLFAAREELLDSLEAATKAHRREIENLRQESALVGSERDEAQSLLERDRISWRKQIALFTQERDMLTRERDESLVAATQERQTQARQLELRAQECEALAAQRDELLSQLNDLREAQSKQNELHHEERRIHAKERSELSARLDQAVRSLGTDRTDLLAQKLDAQYRLEALATSHREELETITSERDASIAERDAAVAELAPIRATQEREKEVLGAELAHKYEGIARDGDEPAGSSQRVRDLMLDREVEIKYLRRAGPPAAADADLIAEARRLAQLQHPNIPPIYEVGFDETGRPYYTTRVVTGMTLRAVLGQLEHGKTRSLLHFTLKRMLGIFHKTCDALAFAHAHGIAHGALDPEHIILGDFGEVFVTDWGLRSQIALPGEYHEEVDVQADIMALGRMLYEIVTLEQPPETGIVRHESTPGKRPGAERTSQSHYWANDTNLNTLLTVARRALDRRAVDQFRSVKEFQMRVDAFKDTFDDPTKLTLRRLFRHWSRQHKTATFFIFLIFILAGAACGYLLTQKMGAYRAQHGELFWRSPSGSR